MTHSALTSKPRYPDTTESGETCDMEQRSLPLHVSEEAPDESVIRDCPIPDERLAVSGY